MPTTPSGSAADSSQLQPARDLDRILITQDLAGRAGRPVDARLESRALCELAETLSQTPGAVLQKLAQMAVELTGAGSAGVSVLERRGEARVFRWRATAGAFFPFVNATLPRDFSPCGIVLDRNATQLMAEPVRVFPYVANLQPHVSEVLLVPFHRGTDPIGTVWIVAHDAGQQFTAEDARVMSVLARFASAAVQAQENLEALEAAAASARLSEEREQEWLLGQNRALDTAAGAAPLADALAGLAEIVEHRSQGGAIASILLLHPDGTLHTAAAPSLPAEYSRAIDGIRAAEGVGTCCHAAACNEVVFTPDIAAAPSWEGLAHLPLALGLKAAWSMPIRGSDGAVLGTFGTYFRECRLPTRQEIAAVEGLCRTAALAIERRAVDEARRESEHKLRVALSAAEIGTWTYAFADSAWELDERAQALYGTPGPVCRHDEALISRILHADDIPQMWDCVRKACDPAGTGHYECDYRAIRPDGSCRWLRAWAHVFFEGEGAQRRPVRMVGSTRDITDAKEAEAELRAAKDAAERASAAKSEFLATLSHELRTPLTPVLLTASLLETHPALPEELRPDVQSIRRNVELESRLISDLLDLTRIEKGKLVLDEQDVDLHLIIRSAIDICQREASSTLVVDLAAQHHTVHGDSTRLQQIFWNLINNAVKFSGDGTITVRSRDDEHGRIRVEVSDTGAGIDPEVLPRLFNAFEQGEARGGKQRAGLGLGLTISRKIAEAHRGTIFATSPGRGQGTTLTVLLPTIEAAIPNAAPAPPLPAPTRHGVSHEPLRVLLVEDHEPTLRVMTRLLRSLGHNVTGANTVASAAAAANQDRFDLLISDLGLPDGSGLDLMRELKAQYAGRAVALTGFGMESDIRASREAGFAEHLTKPVALAALDATIHRLAAREPVVAT